MPTATIEYLGNLRTRNIHLSSGTEINTDAPVDNQGKGETFSPTDLCALSLGNCIITTMGIYAQNHQLHIEGTHATITKHMANDPRRIIQISIDLIVKLREIQDEKAKIALERIVHACPVARSLHPDIKQDVKLSFEQP